MGFKQSVEDMAEGVAFAEGQTAEDLLNRIGSEYYEVSLHEKMDNVHAYDSNVYKVTVKIERM